MIYNVSKLNATKIVIGRRGENLANTIEIDVSEWLAEWPSASIQVIVMRPGDTTPYVATNTSVSGGVLSWSVTNVDTENAGKGKVEVRASSGNVLKKSVLATIEIEPCILCDEDATPPELAPSVADQALAAAVRAEAGAKLAEQIARGTALHNYLDNSDFLNPVNQRGESSVTGAVYGIDRWKGATSNSTVNISADGLTLTHGGTSSIAAVAQTLEPSMYTRLKDCTMTVAVCLSDGTISCRSGVVSAGTFNANFTGGYVQLQIPADTELLRFRIINSVPGSSITVRWVALYKGAYTVDSLPEYRPKGYAAELLECRRYFRRVTGAGIMGMVTAATGYFYLPVEVPMRVKPTVEVTNYGSIRANGVSITPTAITATAATVSNVTINITYASQSVSNHVGILIGNAAFTLSADL